MGKLPKSLVFLSLTDSDHWLPGRVLKLLPPCLKTMFLEVESATEEELACIPKSLTSGRIALSQPLPHPPSLDLVLSLPLGPYYTVKDTLISQYLTRRRKVAVDAAAEHDFVQLKAAINGDIRELIGSESPKLKSGAQRFAFQVARSEFLYLFKLKQLNRDHQIENLISLVLKRLCQIGKFGASNSRWRKEVAVTSWPSYGLSLFPAPQVSTCLARKSLLPRATRARRSRVRIRNRVKGPGN